MHGFKFRNAFKGSPLPVSLGKLDSALGVPQHYGLCGGMSAAAADLFLARRNVPSDIDVPAKGTELYGYIYRRQVDSLDDGLQQAAKFAAWMGAPDAGPIGTRAMSMSAIHELHLAVAKGKPVMLGLVLTSREAKGKLWENHQVMAYDMHEGDRRADAARNRDSNARPSSGTPPVPEAIAWSVLIYDPNFPGIDDARLDMRLTLEAVVRVPAMPGVPGVLIPVLGIETTRRASGRRDTPVRGVFVMPYTPADPGTLVR